MRILGIAGSLRRGSQTQAVRGRATPSPGRSSCEWEPRQAGPHSTRDLGPNQPEPVRAFRAIEEARAADRQARVQRSVPGAMEERDRLGVAPVPRKTYLKRSPPRRRRQATACFGAVWAQAEVRKTLKASGRARHRVRAYPSAGRRRVHRDGHLADRSWPPGWAESYPIRQRGGGAVEQSA